MVHDAGASREGIPASFVKWLMQGHPAGGQCMILSIFEGNVLRNVVWESKICDFALANISTDVGRRIGACAKVKGCKPLLTACVRRSG